MRYPGDVANGTAAEVYNCRCTMCTVEPPEIMQGEDERMTYPEWLQTKEGQEATGGKYVENSLDNGGESGIIEKTKDYDTFGLLFVSHRDDLYKYAKKLAPLDGYEDVTFHADRDSFLILDPDTQDIVERVTPDKLAQLLNNSENYISGTKIRLLSCQSAYGDNSIAQQLADIMNVEVLAPTETLAISNDGQTFISDNLLLIDMWSNGEDVQPTGYWKTLTPNKKE